MSIPDELRTAVAGSSLKEGDQIVIRYLDEPETRSRPLAFTLSATNDDRLNGYLALA